MEPPGAAFASTADGFLMDGAQVLQVEADATSGARFLVSEIDLEEVEHFLSVHKEARIPVCKFRSRMEEIRTRSLLAWKRGAALQLLKAVDATSVCASLLNQKLASDFEALASVEVRMEEEIVQAHMEACRADSVVADFNQFLHDESQTLRTRLKELKDERESLREQIRAVEADFRQLLGLRQSLALGPAIRHLPAAVDKKQGSGGRTAAAEPHGNAQALNLSLFPFDVYQALLEQIVGELREEVASMRAAGCLFPEPLGDSVKEEA